MSAPLRLSCAAALLLGAPGLPASPAFASVVAGSGRAAASPAPAPVLPGLGAADFSWEPGLLVPPADLAAPVLPVLPAGFAPPAAAGVPSAALPEALAPAPAPLVSPSVLSLPAALPGAVEETPPRSPAAAVVAGLESRPELAQLAQGGKEIGLSAGLGAGRRFFDAGGALAGFPEAVEAGPGGGSAVGLAPHAGAPAAPREPGAAFGALLGAALPLSLWPQVLWFALPLTALAALLLADVYSRRALSRRILSWFRPSGSVADLTRDAGAFFPREADAGRVRQFLERWREAPPAARKELAAAAAAAPYGQDLLVAAYLAEALEPSPEKDGLPEEILSRITPGREGALSPAAEAVSRILAKRAELRWLVVPRLRAPLSELARRTLGMAPERVRPPSRVSVAAGILFLGAMTALLSWSALKTLEFDREQERARLGARAIVFGDSEFIFTDLNYRDQRIPQSVLPVLQNWARSDPASQEKLRAAIDILRSSSDPRADNVIEAILFAADRLSLSEPAEDLLLKTLIERDNPRVWGFIERFMREQRNNPMASARLVRMIHIASESGRENAFRTLFHFLKSPDGDVREAAVSAIGALLDDPDRVRDPLAYLAGISQRHDRDVRLQLWVETFLLRYLWRPDASSAEFSTVSELLNRIVDQARAADVARRLPLVARTWPGREGDLPETWLEESFALMRRSLEEPPAPGRVPTDILAAAVRDQVYRAGTNLMKEGQPLYPGLTKGLQDAGVFSPTPGSWNGGFGTEGYRYRYTLAQLRALGAALESRVPAPGAVPQREFSDRARRLLEAALAAGDKAGIPAGGTPGERLADEIVPVIHEVSGHFPGDGLLAFLRREGAIPNVPRRNAMDNHLIYGETHDQRSVEKALALMERLLASGRSWDVNGRPDAMPWYQKRFLSGGINALEASLDRHFPLPGGAARSSYSRSLNELAAAKDEAALLKAFEAAPVKDRFLAQLNSIQAARKDDAAYQLWLTRFMAGVLARPGAAAFDREGVSETLGRAFDAAVVSGDDAAERSAWRALAQGLDASKGGVHPGFLDLVRARVDVRAKAAYERAHQARLEAGDLDSALALRAAMRRTAALSDADVLGDNLTLFQLGELARAAPEEAKGADSRLGLLLSAARKAGVPDGGSAGERAAARANAALHELVTSFYYPEEVNKALRSSGLAPAAGTDRKDPFYRSSYAPEDLRRFQRAAEGLLADGKLWVPRNSYGVLPGEQKARLLVCLERLDAALEGSWPGEAPLGERLRAQRVGALKDADLAAWAGEGLMIWRLKAAQQRHQDDPALQLGLLRLMLQRLEAPGSSSLGSMSELQDVWAAAAAELEKAGRAGPAWADLEARLARLGPGASPGFLEFSRQVVGRGMRALTPRAELAFPALAEEFFYAGVDANHTVDPNSGFANPNAGRQDYRIRHLRALREAVLAQAEKAGGRGKLNALQRGAYDAAKDQLPVWISAAERSAMPGGDSRAERTGDVVSGILFRSWEIFSRPGQTEGGYPPTFLEKLKEAGILKDFDSAMLDRETGLPQSYSRFELVRILRFYEGWLASGSGWEVYSKDPRPLEPEERRHLESSIARLRELLAEYPPLWAPLRDWLKSLRR